MRLLILSLFLLILVSCNENATTSYGNALAAFKQKTDVIELTSADGKARIMVSPKLQGRIISSTYAGLNGACNGWFNQDLLEKEGELIGGIGGEDRLWIGPLGSQHSFYYQQIKPLSEDNWAVPAAMEMEPYELLEQTDELIRMSKRMDLTNFMGTEISLKVERQLSLLTEDAIKQNLGVALENLDYVAFESNNTLTNIGKTALADSTGLVAAWSAGMFEGSEATTIILPVDRRIKKEDILTYMGPLGSDRLKFVGSTVLFKGDGRYRSKIGIPPSRAASIYGCYAKDKKRLTIVQFNISESRTYGNSEVSIQEEPYDGEAIPIYNNGPMDYLPTSEVSFFELESTSSYEALRPGEKLYHAHSVYHFSGEEIALDEIVKTLLGISLSEVLF